jgi:hypothetical protein
MISGDIWQFHYRMYFRLYDRDGKTNLSSTYTY